MAKDRDIKLTPEQYSTLERAMQWPEDLAKYDRIASPTKLTEIFAQVAPPKKEKK